jgi:putative phosphoribosyl transferase
MIKNRTEAGQKLAEKLQDIVKGNNVIVLAIPRGGVVVGVEIAKKLGCMLDVVIAKKITPPDNPEYAVGAITHDGTIYYGPHWKQFSQVPNFEKEIMIKKLQVKKRLENFRANDKYKIDGKTVILVDDGIATGATVFVLLKWLSKQNIEGIILATPVIPANTFEEMTPSVNSIVALQIPNDFHAVGQFYQNFDEVSDEEVLNILKKFKKDIEIKEL